MIDKEIQSALDALSQKIDSQHREIQDLTNRLQSARVIIKNFEGAFKIATATPTTDDTQDGCIYLVNNSGTYSLSAYINNGWRNVTLT